MPLSGSDIEKEVKALGKNFAAYKADLSDRKKLYAIVEQILATHNAVDILINNAGIIKRAPAAAHSDDFWDEVLNINLSAQFILSREIGKHMLQRGSGKIIFTCSLLSFQGGINVPGYTASKSALAGLVRALGNEWGSKGVQVNGIAPGYIATDNTQALREDAQRNKSILERIPAGRWGAPEDFKGPAVFLASAASDYVNGTILFVDGGWMAR
jgi:2-deoxy-D-gluconate 3-dehydrogenase